MHIVSMSTLLLLIVGAAPLRCQQITAPEPRPATIDGVVTDGDGRAIFGATVTVSLDLPGAGTDDHRATKTARDGSFSVAGLSAAVPYRVAIQADGFAEWSSLAPITLAPGEHRDLPNVTLAVGAVETSVTAVDAEELAIEQVGNEEHQRILGIIPNFYVVYDSRFVPLSSKLKFKLAFRTSTDIVNIAGSAFLAGVNQATAARPDYRQQGAAGYGKRFGAAYAGSVDDVMMGSAVLPALLHQDPRYFYQGTGTKKSRALHAISAPFVARGDNGKPQFNFSSVGGDLITGAVENAYFPPHDRGPGLVFTGAALETAGSVVNALLEEFVLNKVTTKGKKHNQIPEASRP